MLPLRIGSVFLCLVKIFLSYGVTTQPIEATRTTSADTARALPASISEHIFERELGCARYLASHLQALIADAGNVRSLAREVDPPVGLVVGARRAALAPQVEQGNPLRPPEG